MTLKPPRTQHTCRISSYTEYSWIRECQMGRVVKYWATCWDCGAANIAQGYEAAQEWMHQHKQSAGWWM